MDQIRDLLRAQLTTPSTVSAIWAVESYSTNFRTPVEKQAGPGDEGELSSQREERERSFGTRRAVIEKANQLAEAIERLAAGSMRPLSGMWRADCPGRLRAVPEATRVLCRDRQERGISSRGRPSGGARLYRQSSRGRPISAARYCSRETRYQVPVASCTQ